MRGRETRSCEECFTPRIERKNVADDEVDTDRDYVLFREDGRILQNYLQWFDAQNIKIVFMEDMTETPEAFVKDVYRCLEVRDDFLPGNLGRLFRTQRSLAGSAQETLC